MQKLQIDICHQKFSSLLTLDRRSLDFQNHNEKLSRISGSLIHEYKLVLADDFELQPSLIKMFPSILSPVERIVNLNPSPKKTEPQQPIDLIPPNAP